MCGSWSSTFLSPPSPPSSSSPANSKTEPMTVGSEVHTWTLVHLSQLFVTPVLSAGKNNKEENVVNISYEEVIWTKKHEFCVIMDNIHYFLVYSTYLHFVYIVSKTVKSLWWNAVLFKSWKWSHINKTTWYVVKGVQYILETKCWSIPVRLLLQNVFEEDKGFSFSVRVDDQSFSCKKSNILMVTAGYACDFVTKTHFCTHPAQYYFCYHRPLIIFA